MNNSTTFQELVNLSHKLPNKPKKTEIFEIVRRFMHLMEENHLNEITDGILLSCMRTLQQYRQKKNKLLPIG